MVRQSEVVVGTEVQHFLTFYLDSSLLRTLDEAFLLVQTSLLDVLQFFLEMSLEFTVHGLLYLWGLK